MLTEGGVVAGPSLEWSDIDLDALDHDGNPVGEITPQGGSHTKRTGVIGLEISPGLRELLEAMRPKDGKGRVFPQTRDEANAALRRLVREHNAPARATWQAMRRSTGTYLTNAPGIFGAASAYRSAKQLGHSVTVAEKHYVGLVRGIPASAKTLETAMQLEKQIQLAIEAVDADRAPG